MAAARRRATTAPRCCRSTATCTTRSASPSTSSSSRKTGASSPARPNELSSYKYFGTPIHAVADGVVVKLLDGEPEQTPGGFPELPVDKIDGNFVVMDIGNGRYAFYAHFQAGLKVRLGQRVRQGQVLGLLGNTGNCDAPHLHFHVMDSPSPLGSNGLPYVFTKFRGEGFVTNQEDTFRRRSRRSSIPTGSPEVSGTCSPATGRSSPSRRSPGGAGEPTLDGVAVPLPVRTRTIRRRRRTRSCRHRSCRCGWPSR